MGGYSANARLHGGVPRFVGGGGGGDTSPEAPVLDASENGAAANHAWTELVGRSFDARLAAWLADLRESWAQATFFLFDPESWR